MIEMEGGEMLDKPQLVMGKYSVGRPISQPGIFLHRCIFLMAVCGSRKDSFVGLKIYDFVGVVKRITQEQKLEWG